MSWCSNPFHFYINFRNICHFPHKKHAQCVWDCLYIILIWIHLQLYISSSKLCTYSFIHLHLPYISKLCFIVDSGNLVSFSRFTLGVLVFWYHKWHHEYFQVYFSKWYYILNTINFFTDFAYCTFLYSLIFNKLSVYSLDFVVKIILFVKNDDANAF